VKINLEIKETQTLAVTVLKSMWSGVVCARQRRISDRNRYWKQFPWQHSQSQPQYLCTVILHCSKPL